MDTFTAVVFCSEPGDGNLPTEPNYWLDVCLTEEAANYSLYRGLAGYWERYICGSQITTHAPKTLAKYADPECPTVYCAAPTSMLLLETAIREVLTDGDFDFYLWWTVAKRHCQ